MLYFDNAATTWPKPPEVLQEMTRFLQEEAGNPGRGGHRLAVQAESRVLEVRSRIAKLLGAKQPSSIVFTLNATDSLNVAIKGVVTHGAHVISTMLEHNSVTRPLVALQRAGVIELDRVCSGRDTIVDPDDFAKLFRKNTKLVVVTHCSNVTGALQPIREIARLAREHDAVILIDASQSAGVVPIDVDADGIDLLAAPGHKGLMGPPGTGLLFVREGVKVSPFREGGSGSHSESPIHPDQMPMRLEAGTPNTVGIVGLGAGLKFLETRQTSILEHERALLDRFVGGVRELPGLQLHGPTQGNQRIGLTCVTVEGMDGADVAAILDSSFGVAVRAGLHCAPVAHQMLGTLPRGTVRFSFGAFNTAAEVDQAVSALSALIH